MISGVNVRVDTTVLDAIRETARKAPGLMTTAYTRATRRLRARMLAELRKPGKPSFPGITKLMTPKQRKKFWASNGFGRGIPTQRTGELQAGYDVIIAPLDSNSATMEITSSTPYQTYVSGAQVQPFHIERYVQTTDVAIEFEAEANDVLTETWWTVSDYGAGVR
jgi:hypothetical protein